MSNTLISILAGLGGMFGWGTSDFLANTSSEKIGHDKTFFWSQIAGLLLVLFIVLLHGPNFSFSPLLILLIIISGAAYALGYLLFYNGFEIGNVSVVSAVVNLQNLFIIIIAYFLFHQRIYGIQIPGVILLLIGVTVVSINFEDLKKGKMSLIKGAKESFLASIMFGVFFWPVNQYIVHRADWLTVNLITKFVAISTVFLIANFTRKNISLKKTDQKSKIIIPVIAVGLLEATGVLSVSGGLSVGNAIIIGPIAASLTIVTIVLSVIFLKEKITKIQFIGIAVTILGIILVGLGG